MDTIATLEFRDNESAEAALAIVRRSDDTVALCLSILNDGDVEVFMSYDDARRLIAALQAAVAGP